MTRERDHFLAATHLRGFSSDGRRLWQSDLRDQTIRRISVRDAAVERGLNTVVRDGVPDRSLESFMDRFNENVAGPILARLKTAPTGAIQLSRNDNVHLARYIALAYARSPQQRAKSTERARAVARRMAADIAHPSSFAERMTRAGVRMDAFALEVVRLKLYEQLRRGNLPKDVQLWPISVGAALGRPPLFIGAMSKFVIRRKADPLMICGDSAVVLMYDDRYDAPGDLGFARHRDVRVVVPVSAEAFLICGFVEADNEAERLSVWSRDAFASFVNCASLDHARRYAFGLERADLETALAELRESRVPGFTPTQIAAVMR